MSSLDAIRAKRAALLAKRGLAPADGSPAPPAASPVPPSRASPITPSPPTLLSPRAFDGPSPTMKRPLQAPELDQPNGKRARTDSNEPPPPAAAAAAGASLPSGPLDAASILSYRSVRARASTETNSSIDALLTAPTLRQKVTAKTFQQLWVDREGKPVGVQEFCTHKQAKACEAARMQARYNRARSLGVSDPTDPRYPPWQTCEKIHLVVQQRAKTDLNLGECSYTSSCGNRACRFVHYAIDEADRQKVAERWSWRPTQPHHPTRH